MAKLPGIDIKYDQRDDHPIEIDVKTGQERQQEEALEATHKDSIMSTPAEPGPIVESDMLNSASIDASRQEWQMTPSQQEEDENTKDKEEDSPPNLTTGSDLSDDETNDKVK